MSTIPKIGESNKIDINISETSLGWKIPLLTKDFWISQGFNGPHSHFNNLCKGRDFTYSVDLATRVNTVVSAARDGIVAYIFKNEEDERWYYDGADSKIGRLCIGNHIIFSHGKGIYSFYEHLSGEGLSEFKIQEGKRVGQGEVIGRTGLSGWVGPIPHLHFSVFAYKGEAKVNTRNINTIPFKFDDYKGSLEHKDLFPELNYKK